MMYKAFAALTLIAAPLVVLIVQGLVPQGAQSPAAIAPAAAIVPHSAPPVATAQPAPMPSQDQTYDPASFGQPMPDAGKPFLAPGAGLPDAPVTEPMPVETEPPSPDGAPQ